MDLRKTHYQAKTKDGIQIGVILNDTSYDDFTVGFFNKEGVLIDKKRFDIYGLVEISVDAYEYFKAQQRGTTVGNLYED